MENELTVDLEKTVGAYTDENISKIEPLPGGHINMTFLVTGRGRYILQLLNPQLFAGYTDILEHNYLQYKSACEQNTDKPWFCPKWIKNRDGRYIYEDENGLIWRMYWYISSDADHGLKQMPDVYEIGRGLGRLHKILRSCDDIRSIETTKYLHDLNYFYRKYREQSSSEMPRIRELDQFIETYIDNMLEVIVPPGAVIHGDAKVSNMIIKDGKAAGFIDLDTLMPGSSFNDFSDCARSCCLDENYRVDPQKAFELLRGYQDGAQMQYAEDAIKLQFKSIISNRFTLGLRYYIDYLSQEGYFGIEDPKKELEKAVHLIMADF